MNRLQNCTTCKYVEPTRKNICTIIKILTDVINLPDVLTVIVTSYFGPTWWKCSADIFSRNAAYIDVTVENAIALTLTLPIKMQNIYPNNAFMVPNLRIMNMHKSRNITSKWMKCASFYNSVNPDVHQHVVEYFRSTSSSEFFQGSWFKHVANVFSTPYSNDDELEDDFSIEFHSDAAKYIKKIRTNVFDFLFSLKYTGNQSPCNGPITIIVFVLITIAVTQNLESEIFPRLFMWAYGFNSVSDWRLDFRKILNYNLTLVLNLGNALDEHFYFCPDRGGNHDIEKKPIRDDDDDTSDDDTSDD